MTTILGLTRTIEDDQPAPMPALGWDGLNADNMNADNHRNRLIVLDHHGNSRRRMDNRSPFPPGFVVGSHGDPLGGQLLLLSYDEESLTVG
jgi:E3 ubiquitin-protein ligase HUWE1